MSDVLQDVLWTEKYRPSRLEDVALDEETRRLLEQYLAAGDIPHLLFVGPPGTGKTTVARILYRTLDCQHIVLNASSERGIDVVRKKIGQFARSLTHAHRNVVFLDEADAMTSDAQTAMRNLIEAYEHTRFILTANQLYRVIGPIQSRCQVLEFGRPPIKERFRIATRVLQEEEITADPKVVLSYVERYPDLRTVLMAMQRAVLSRAPHAEGIVLPPAAEDAPAGGAEMLEMLVKKNWTGFRRLTTSPAFDAQQALRELFWAVPDEHARGGFLRHTIGKGVHETVFTPDPIILFLGVVAEAMEGL